MSLTAGLVGAAVGGSVLNSYLQWRENEYQHGLQRDIFNREDTSIQRLVADLKAAGLSPVLAAGQGAGTGGVVSTTVPQTDLSDRVLSALSLMKMEADISKTRAEEAYVNLQANNAGIMLPSQLASMEAGIKNADAQTYRTYMEAKKTAVEAKNMTDTGTSGSNIFSQAFRDIYGAMSKASSEASKIIDKQTPKTRAGFHPFWTEDGQKFMKEQIEKANKR